MTKSKLTKKQQIDKYIKSGLDENEPIPTWYVNGEHLIDKPPRKRKIAKCHDREI